MNTDALRQQIRSTIRAKLTDAHTRAAPAQNPSPNQPSLAPSALVIPLRLGSAQDTAVLTQLFQQLAASPALLKMADTGLLRFDLRVDAAALGAMLNGVLQAFGPPAPGLLVQGPLPARDMPSDGQLWLH